MIYVGECFAMFSSRSFIVSGLTFRSLIHFEFIFVYGVRKCSGFILLQVLEDGHFQIAKTERKLPNNIHSNMQMLRRRKRSFFSCGFFFLNGRSARVYSG